MARISQRILNNLRDRSEESCLSAVHERMTNKGLTPVAVKDGHAYGIVENEEGQRLFRFAVGDFFAGKGEMGEFEDVTEEYGVRNAESSRDRERVAVAYAEAVISRDRVEASQRLRELVQTV